MHGSDGFEVLLDDAFQCSPTFLHVAFQAPDESDVRIGIDKDLDIQQLSDFGQCKNQNPLDENNGLRLDRLGLRESLVATEVIQR